MTHDTTWADRLAASDGIDIRPVPEGRRGMTPGRLMLYPSARMVNDVLRETPEGQAVTPKELRATLGDRYDAEYTCPVTTMMLRIVGEAANEARENGEPADELTPIWRVPGWSASSLRKLTFDPAWLLEEPGGRRDRRPLPGHGSTRVTPGKRSILRSNVQISVIPSALVNARW